MSWNKETEVSRETAARKKEWPGWGVRPELVTAHGRLSSGQVASFGGSERGDREGWD